MPFLHGTFFSLHREDKEYLVDDDGVIRSVENLRQLQNVKWVVLSLGGNVPWEAMRRGGMTNGRPKARCGGMVLTCFQGELVVTKWLLLEKRASSIFCP